MKVVTIEEKKEFVNWLLKNYQLKQRHCYWIMRNLLIQEELFERVHFVRNAEQYEKGLKMSLFGSKGEEFSYHLLGGVLEDANEMYHHIRKSFQQNLHIEIVFPKGVQPEEYEKVLVDEDDIPEGTEKDAEWAGQVLEEELIKGARKRIEEKIDQALAHGEKEQFFEWLAALEEIKIAEKETLQTSF